MIDNENGSAPGYIIEDNNKIIFLLPGPPVEMIPMFEGGMLPYLKKLQDKVFISRMVKICGIGESTAETMILDLIEKQESDHSALRQGREVHFRITASADNEDDALNLLIPFLMRCTHDSA